MLNPLRSFFGSPEVKTHRPGSIEVLGGLPIEIASTGVAPFPLADMFEIVHDLPTPDWAEFNRWIEDLGSDNARATAWGECEVAWLLDLRESLGSN